MLFVTGKSSVIVNHGAFVCHWLLHFDGWRRELNGRQAPLSWGSRPSLHACDLGVPPQALAAVAHHPVAQIVADALPYFGGRYSSVATTLMRPAGTGVCARSTPCGGGLFQLNPRGLSGRQCLRAQCLNCEPQQQGEAAMPV
jgi:hypothetical protein